MTPMLQLSFGIIMSYKFMKELLSEDILYNIYEYIMPDCAEYEFFKELIFDEIEDFIHEMYIITEIGPEIDPEYMVKKKIHPPIIGHINRTKHATRRRFGELPDFEPNLVEEENLHDPLKIFDLRVSADKWHNERVKGTGYWYSNASGDFAITSVSTQ